MYLLLVLFCFVNVKVDSGIIKCYNKNLFQLDIVHYNDFHDRFEETSVGYPVCRTNDTNCLGGFARLYHQIRALLRRSPDALLLNAGDVFQGTYWYTLLKWNNTQRFINLLPHDAHTIGNHEFDDGVIGLAPYLAALEAPVVITNMDCSAEPALNGLYRPHHILYRGGRRIGIIGLITPETKLTSNAGRVVFLDPIESAQNEAHLLTNKYMVDIVILLSHCGLDVDRKLAKMAGENIDIIVGGHSHSLLWNGKSPSGETVSGPYPVIVESDKKPGHKVLIVTASAFTKYLGYLKTYFDEFGELQFFEGKPIFLNRSVPEDDDIKDLLRPQMEALHTIVNEIVGSSNTTLDATPCGAGECVIGNLIADSFVDATKQKVNESNEPFLGFLLRNMIRGSIPKGVITRGNVMNCLPFTNKVVTFLIAGKHIISAVERCLTNYWVAKPFNGPWMPHLSGMKVTLDTSQRKVTTAEMLTEGNYVLLEFDRLYRITTTSFLGDGGNGFEMFKEHKINTTYVGKENEILEEYIKQHSPLNVKLENRLTVVN